MQASFDGTLQIADGAAPRAKGAVRIEAADLEPWLMTTGLSFPGMGLGTPVSLTADLDFASRLLVAFQHPRARSPTGRSPATSMPR